MMDRLYYHCLAGGYPIVRPPSVIVTAFVDAEPYEYKPEPPGAFTSRMLRLYRGKRYPLGKTKRGFKKWVKRRLLEMAGCKTFNQAKRKYKKR